MGNIIQLFVGNFKSFLPFNKKWNFEWELIEAKFENIFIYTYVDLYLKKKKPKALTIIYAL